MPFYTPLRYPGGKRRLVPTVVYNRRECASLEELGFAALFLNRTNRSGIIGGGVIGGKKQTGAWSLDARFTKPELIERIQRIGRFRSRIHLHQLDALKFTTQIVANLGQRSFCLYDPPYIEKSEDLYLNTYDLPGHQQLAARVSRLKQPWIVTYDHVAIDAGLYEQHRRMVYGLNYSAQKRYEGKEVMFLADHLALPEHWRERRWFSLSGPRSEYPLFGKLVH